MPAEPMPDDRLDALEMRVAEQDRTIDDLNRTVTAQWDAIDALTRRIGQVAAQLETAETRSGGLPPPQRPPHY